jgi:hypothetical protein
MYTGGSTVSKVIINYLIIKLSLLKKSLKKRNNEIITQYLTGCVLLRNTSRSGAQMTGVKIKNSKVAVQR